MLHGELLALAGVCMTGMKRYGVSVQVSSRQLLLQRIVNEICLS